VGRLALGVRVPRSASDDTLIRRIATVAQAELIASKMVSDGRMSAMIDQVDAVIDFQTESESINNWDAAIARVCHKTEQIVLRAIAKHPHLAAGLGGVSG
jgi:hypothetical protein